ncbi:MULTISPECIES: phosphoribosylglycinamide formyltransferase [Burkholderia]|uniref:Phosphoribosylglycinamide formyltransferase n=2 Tax=Burkholderia humptydooensis TaxID=430531 RepID=A0A7U4P5S4_9BURK|nr:MULTISPECIES: phosphoribosylglycinamide formyltransferase [Burkholderia]AGK46467.1 phosphoribosylglycinamide formyltransferase [Burkholderia thailandensis MSMB121]ATF34618.1 phosphoribosylglycinamide formyltransferase [Burkholderia thailandensis]AJY42648.1 phosphoribosylglycinamide formyltransferase [Burkholderia sp. 2002721687]ALX43496.1 phosphoribosylglycinamide formyltransferase [Burkholderia humptydooensis]EIP90210.1 phosphoribosylglycinamide formyltransferase [Burkholderia humptydooens
MKKLVILISGRGSNMEAIVRACAREGWPAEVAAVISNRPDAAGLEFAASHGIATAVVDHRAFDGRDSFDAALAVEVDRFAPDLIVLAGFMRILTPAFVAKYEGRMLNIHPSLLPSFKGIHTHQQALDAGVALHGASVHFVIPELDSGAIVAQAAVPVVAGDDAGALAARVLAAEHVLYPRAVRWFVEGKLRLDAGRAIVAPDEARWLFADAIDTSTSEGV